MSPEQVAAQYRAAMARHGETVTLARPKVNGTFGPVLARATNYRADGPMYDLQQGERMFIVLADDVASSGFPLPFKPNADKLTSSGDVLTIKSVDDSTRRIAGVLVAYEIKAAGA
jgi:hypothetical protein